MTGGVQGIADWRAARQRIAGVPDLSIKTLGATRIESPLAARLDARQTTEHYVGEGDRVLLDDTLGMVQARGGSIGDLPSFEPAGPRRKIFFDPSKTWAGIVTCGGLCPGLNDVIRGLVRNLTYHYGVPRVVGFRNGYQGFIASYRHDVVDLTPQSVRDINVDGGTVLGTSRRPQDPHEVVDCLFTVEAKSTAHGIGLVKLMGRHSGFIACYAALARNDADVVLIPEVAFQLDGDGGLLQHLERRVRERGYAVVVVAEGAGQELLDGEEAANDASGNAGLRDVGTLLRRRFAEHFAAVGIEACIRFIDPSYAIRSVPANPYERCLVALRWSSAGGAGASCTSRWRWRSASATRWTRTVISGCQSWKPPGSQCDSEDDGPASITTAAHNRAPGRY